MHLNLCPVCVSPRDAVGENQPGRVTAPKQAVGGIQLPLSGVVLALPSYTAPINLFQMGTPSVLKPKQVSPPTL